MQRQDQIVRETLKAVWYQFLSESLKWLRNNELRYGKNPTDEGKKPEIDNPQPSL